jgi:hypothetical protein
MEGDVAQDRLMAFRVGLDTMPLHDRDTARSFAALGTTGHER